MQLDTGIRISGWDNIEIGDSFSMLRLGSLQAVDGKISIGHDVSINTNVNIDACNGGRIEIADGVLIGPNVVLRAADHRHENIDCPIRLQGHQGGVIFIGAGTWIGANVVITKDVIIGAHAIIAAGAVVTGDVAPFTIAAGVPARVIRNRLGVRPKP